MPGLQNEATGVDAFIYSRLSADSELLSLLGGTAKIYSELAPESTPTENHDPPYVLLSFLASVDVNSVGSDRRVMTRPVYAVRAVTTGFSFAGADQIADRIDAVLMGARGTTDNGTLSILGMFREEIIRRVEVMPGGVRVNYVGGRYRCFVTAA
jgi:hypothetical protein